MEKVLFNVATDLLSKISKIDAFIKDMDKKSFLGSIYQPQYNLPEDLKNKIRLIMEEYKDDLKKSFDQL